MQVIGSASNIQNIGQSIVSNPIEVADDASFSFYDLLDIVNPLQHIPIISNIYQAASGDTMGAVANVVGSTIFGGPIGGAIAFASEIADEIFGGDEQVALKPTVSSTEDASAAKQATQAYSKMRVTTQDWLNPNFNSFA